MTAWVVAAKVTCEFALEMTRVFLAASKSMGTGFPRDGWRWVWMGLVTGTIDRGDRARPGQGARGEVWRVKVKALFTAQFWSTTQAMVATEFWIWVLRALWNLTTMVLGSE